MEINFCRSFTSTTQQTVVFKVGQLCQLAHAVGDINVTTAGNDVIFANFYHVASASLISRLFARIVLWILRGWCGETYPLHRRAPDDIHYAPELPHPAPELPGYTIHIRYGGH